MRPGVRPLDGSSDDNEVRSVSWGAGIGPDVRLLRLDGAAGVHVELVRPRFRAGERQAGPYRHLGHQDLVYPRLHHTAHPAILAYLCCA